MKKMKKIALTVLAWLVPVIIAYFVVIVFFIPNVNLFTLKPFFQVGHCYQMKNDDPFRTSEIQIRVVDIKGR